MGGRRRVLEILIGIALGAPGERPAAAGVRAPPRSIAGTPGAWFAARQSDQGLTLQRALAWFQGSDPGRAAPGGAHLAGVGWLAPLGAGASQTPPTSAGSTGCKALLSKKRSPSSGTGSVPSATADADQQRAGGIPRRKSPRTYACSPRSGRMQGSFPGRTLASARIQPLVARINGGFFNGSRDAPGWLSKNQDTLGSFRTDPEPLAPSVGDPGSYPVRPAAVGGHG